MLTSKNSSLKQLTYLFIGTLILLIFSVIFSQEVKANTYPGGPLHPSHHNAISSNAGNWTPPKNSSGAFVNGGQHNCKFPQVYPPDNGDGSGRPDQDSGACATGLDASETRYKLFMYNQNKTGFPIEDNTRLVIENGCKDVSPVSGDRGVENGYPYSKPNHPDKGGRKIRVSINSTQSDGGKGGEHRTNDNYPGDNPTNCEGQDLIILVPKAAFSTSQEHRYGNKVSTALVVIYKQGGVEGNKLFKLRYNVGSVYGDDSHHFALASSRKGQRSTYKFEFKVDCSYEGGSVSFRVEDIDFFDDQVEPGYPDVVVTNQSGVTIHTDDTWQNDKTFTIPQSKIAQGSSYIIEFRNVSDGNGLRFDMPFSEYQGYYTGSGPENECPPDSVDGDCERIIVTGPKGRWFKVYIRNHGDPANYGEIPPNGPSTHGSSNDFGGRLPTDGAGSTSSRELRLDSTANTQFEKDKAVTGTLRYSVIIYNGADDSTGRASETSYTKGPCNTADCTVNVDGNLGGSNVKAGQNFNVRVTIRNTGVNGLKLNLTNKPLGGTLYHDGKWGSPGGVSNGTVAPIGLGGTGSIGVNGSREVEFTLAAPNDQNSHQIRLYPDYWGKFGIGPICEGTAVTYQRYDFTGTASSSLDDPESPTAASFATSLTQNGVAVDGTATRTFYKKRNGTPTQIPGFGPLSESKSFGNATYNDPYTIPPNTYILGDSWCVAISLDRGHGWRSGGSYINESPENQDNCGFGESPPVVNKPYVRAYGGDVAAGGGFENHNCGNTNSRILTFFRSLDEQNSTGNRSGSGSQLAAMALGDISGFTSASIRNNDPQLPKGLTFAHDNTIPNSTSLSPVLGGGMTGNGWCVPDYFKATQFTDGPKKEVSTSPSDINVYGLTNGNQTIRNLSGGKVSLISPNTPTYNRKHAVYVDGDVYIRNNIAYNTNFTAGVSSIPSFTLVVKGNIYVSNEVTQLDGLYIAQPNPDRANTGRIYTCSNAVAGGSPIVNTNAVFNDCGAFNESNPPRQLVVNGAFIAERVVLNRTGYTLRDSTFRERANTSKASEIFNFTPEIYLSPPVFRPNSTPTSGDYDYISILAPIL